MKLIVNGQHADWASKDLTVSGSDGIYLMEIELNDVEGLPSWASLSAYAVFKSSAMLAAYPEGIAVPINGGRAEIPAAILAVPGMLYTGVYGTNGSVVMPTIWAPALCIALGCTEGSEPGPEPGPTVLDAARMAIKYGENAEVYAEGGYLVTDVQGPIEDPILIREETYTEGASDYADAAAGSATAAEGSKDAAALSATAAADSARTADAAKDSAVIAQSAAVSAKNDAVSAKNAAQSSASAAAQSEVAAGNSATAASNSATAAAGSKDAAALSAQAASDSKDAAALSAGAAASSATDAATAKAAAEAARDASVAAKTDAESAKNAAAASATAAGNSATAAGNSATAAGNSATAAGNSATAAGNAKIAAEAAAERAEEAAASVGLVDYAYLDANAAGEAVVTLCGDKQATPGDIVSFSDGAAVPVKSLAVAVDAVQEGSGDPSPTNVRPISGHTGATITVDTAYNANAGKTVAVDWTAKAGTVYGGTLAYLGGNKYRLTVNMAGDLTPLTWTRNTTEQSYAFFYADVPGRKGGAQAFLSSELTYVTGGRASLSSNNTVSYYSDSASDTRIAVRADDYADAASFGSYMLGVQMVYELNVPKVYDLTADELATLLGGNVVFADTGDIEELTYRTNENSRTIVLGTTQAGLLIALAPLPVATGEEF